MCPTPVLYSSPAFPPPFSFERRLQGMLSEMRRDDDADAAVGVTRQRSVACRPHVLLAAAAAGARDSHDASNPRGGSAGPGGSP